MNLKTMQIFGAIINLATILICTKENAVNLEIDSEKMQSSLWRTLRDILEPTNHTIWNWNVYINTYARFSMTLYFLGFAKVKWPYR